MQNKINCRKIIYRWLWAEVQVHVLRRQLDNIINGEGPR